MLLCGKQEGASDLGPSAESELMKKAGDQLSSALIAIHQFWLARRK